METIAHSLRTRTTTATTVRARTREDPPAVALSRRACSDRNSNVSGTRLSQRNEKARLTLHEDRSHSATCSGGGARLPRCLSCPQWRACTAAGTLRTRGGTAAGVRGRARLPGLFGDSGSDLDASGVEVAVTRNRSRHPGVHLFFGAGCGSERRASPRTLRYQSGHI